MTTKHGYYYLCGCKVCTGHEKELKKKINGETNKEDYDIKSAPTATKVEIQTEDEYLERLADDLTDRFDVENNGSQPKPR